MSQEHLIQAVKNEIVLYAGASFTSQAYSLFDEESLRYAVVVVPNLPRPYPSRVIVMARILDNKIYIDEDITDKPLVDALVYNSEIPREQIVLVYTGE
ncbi:MAG: hypothetical protein Phog2KO_43140 [Phototrophicaceae bacterium]